jgi:hypothetical protein
MVILIHVGFGSSSLPGISSRNKRHAEHKEVLEFDITEKESEMSLNPLTLTFYQSKELILRKPIDKQLES